MVTGLRAGPPKQQDVTVQNPIGVNAVRNIQIVNGTVNVPAFTPGTTAPIVVTATKTNQAQPTTWSFEVVDASGATTHCGCPDNGHPSKAETRLRNSRRFSSSTSVIASARSIYLTAAAADSGTASSGCSVAST